MPLYSLSDIRDSFNANMDDHSIICRRILRPSSVYFTLLSFRAGIKNPNQATFISLLAGLASVGVFFTGLNGLLWVATVLFLIFMVFDYVDGNIARVTDMASYYGKYIDGAAGNFIETLLPFSLASGFYFSKSNFLFFLGVIASLASIFSAYLINRLSFFNRWVKLDQIEGKSRPSESKLTELNVFKSASIPLMGAMNIMTDLRISALIVASFIGMNIIIYLVILIPIYAYAISKTVVSLSGALSQLNIYRVSKSSTRIKKDNNG